VLKVFSTYTVRLCEHQEKVECRNANKHVTDFSEFAFLLGRFLCGRRLCGQQVGKSNQKDAGNQWDKDVNYAHGVCNSMLPPTVYQDKQAKHDAST
jgi:hypothetical protein